MARENQGLQIALIVFVMLTVLLGVTTYLGFRQYNDAADQRQEAHHRQRQVDNDKAVKDEDITKLKKFIFGPAAAPADTNDVEPAFKEDMKKYGAGYPEESLYLPPSAGEDEEDD